nr:hypothetical protein [Tanacetum cinerariifolium]
MFLIMYTQSLSPTADSPGYITESNPEEDPNEEDGEDPEEDLADYPTNKDDDEESFGDDSNDEEEDEGEERMTVQPQPHMAASTEALITAIAVALTLPSPPPSQLTSYSSPLPHIPSPVLPVSPPLPISPSQLPASPTYPLGYRATMMSHPKQGLDGNTCPRA